MDARLRDAADRIVFPLDVPSEEEARRLADGLGEHVGVLKVGLELFVAAGPSILRYVAERTPARIFLDLKFHDIPQTVARATRAASVHPRVAFVTVHASGGRRLVDAAVQAREGSTKILAITVLTSQVAEEMRRLGHDPRLTMRDLVMLRARLALEAGCDGVVCSGEEAADIKREFGPGFLAVCPGIRPSWSVVGGDDQKRITTPSDAIRAGADFVVVGRPIREAPDPREAVERIAEEIAGVLAPPPGATRIP